MEVGVLRYLNKTWMCNGKFFELTKTQIKCIQVQWNHSKLIYKILKKNIKILVFKIKQNSKLSRTFPDFKQVCQCFDQAIYI